jgi:hypothetical protein
MAAPSSVVTHGTSAAGDLKNEPASTPGVFVESLTFKFTRERREYRNNLYAFRILKYVNPLLVMAFAGWLTTDAGAGNVGGQAVGTEVSALANFGAARRGFDATTGTVGTMIMEDPEDELSIENDAKTKFNVLWAPFVENA